MLAQPMAIFGELFCARRKPLGKPGQFLDERMGKINFAFTANYLGSARAMYDWALAISVNAAAAKTAIASCALAS